MGQAPLTGTVCPFPYANTSDTPLCSQVCSRVLGARYIGLQVTCLSATSISLVLFVCKIFLMHTRYKLEQQAGGRETRRSALRKTLGFWSYICLFVLGFLVSSIDIRGYAGIVNPVVYVIANEIAGASLICAGLVLIDFWIACASATGRSGIAFKRPIIAFVYFNFILLAILIVTDVERSSVYDGIKAFVASVVIVLWGFLAIRPMRDIRKTLLRRNLHSEEDHCENNVKSDSKPFHQRRQMVAALDRKFGLFYTIIVIGSIMYFVAGVAAFQSKDPVIGYRWKMPCEINPVNIFSKLVQLFSCILAFTFFSVTRGQSVTMTSSDKREVHSELVPTFNPEVYKAT